MNRAHPPTHSLAHPLAHPFAGLAGLALLTLAILGFSRAPGAPGQPDRAEGAKNAIRFESVDVFVDSGPQPLAAYQFELTAPAEPGFQSVIVGVEGGEHAAYASPPYYDPKALQNDRIIIASFSLAEELPTGRTRVARLHMQVRPAPAPPAKPAAAPQGPTSPDKDTPAPTAKAPAESPAIQTPTQAPASAGQPARSQPARREATGQARASTYTIQLMTAATRDGAPAKAEATVRVTGGAP